MKKYSIVFVLIMLIGGCSFQNPKDILSQSVKTMSELKGYKMDTEMDMQAGVLGINMDFVSKDHAELEKNGDSRSIMLEVKESFNGNAIPTSKTYLSESKVGIYNNQTGQWQFHTFNPNDENDQEDKWLVTEILSLYNPESTANQFLNSQANQSVKTVGTATINGVDCVGISVQIEAKEFMKNLGDFLGKASDVDGAGGLVEALGNGALKNTKTIYWIGKNDHYIHRYETSLDGTFARINIISNISGYNQPISMK